MPAEQLNFFHSLDFPGRTTLYLWEIAERLGCSVRHLLNEVDAGALVGLDLSADKSKRRSMRVPIESYQTFVVAHLTAPVSARVQHIKNLPRAVRLQLIEELKASL